MINDPGERHRGCSMSAPRIAAAMFLTPKRSAMLDGPLTSVARIPHAAPRRLLLHAYDRLNGR